MITFTANIRNARAVSDDALTVSSAGVPIKLNLAPEFNGLAKTLTFVNGAISVDLVLQGDPTEAVVPHEVLSVPGQLRIGIYAANPEGTVVIPTIWAQAGRVAPGAAPSGIDPSAPTPNWAAQTQSIAESALEIAESVQTRIDNGDFTDVLWVSYGATSAEVEAAYQTGKVICMKYMGRNYILTNRVTSTNHCFISALLSSANHSLYYAVCSNNNWTSGSVGVPQPSSWNPKPLGAAAPGTSNLYSRYDHVHKMPSASDVGAIATPASPTDGDVLTYDGSSNKWVAEAPSGGGGAVSSVNGQTGDVVLGAEDVGAYSKPSGGIPKTDLASAVQTSLGKADTAYQKPSGGIPATDIASGVIPSVPSAYTSNPAALGTASPGSSTAWARGDHVHAKPTYSKSDVGLGNVDNVRQYSASNPPPYPVTSVNGQTGAVSLSIPSSAADVGAVAVAQGVAHAGEFVVVGSDGNITTVTMATWQGGSY